jgi:hypothetical protein
LDTDPLILLIDDDDQSSTALQLEQRGVRAQWLYPTDVDQLDLVEADLLVVDEYFDLRDTTPPPDAPRVPADLPLSLVPEDGIALSAVLRSAANKAREDRPVGICLRTGQLDRLTAGIPQGVRQPWLAAARDLEWVTSKHVDATAGTPIGTLNDELISLAHAIRTYPRAWPRGRVRDVGTTWLRIPDTAWAVRARHHVAQCRPPLDSTSNQQSLAWFRWLAQRALPYPTFVLSDVRVATTLGVTLDSFRTVTAQASEFANRMNAARYTGPLAALHPPRYWRAAIQDLAAEVAGEVDADDPLTVGAALAGAFPALVELQIEQPVVCIDAHYRETGEVIEQDTAERLVPDGWPAYADSVWAAKTAIDSELSDLRAPRLR